MATTHPTIRTDVGSSVTPANAGSRSLDSLLKYALTHGWQWLIVGITFSIPIQTRWIWHDAMVKGEIWEYGRFSLFGIDLLLVAALLFFLISRLSGLQIKLAHLKHQLSPLVVMSLVGLLLTSFVSLYFAADQQMALYQFVRLLTCLALFYLITQLTISWRIPSWALVLSGSIQSLIALAEFLWQRIPASQWLGVAAQNPTDLGVQVVLTSTGRFLRSYGTFPHPNILGGFLVLSIVLAIALLLTTAHRRQQLTLHGLLPLMAAGLFLTFSRQSILGLMIALIAFPAFLARRANQSMLRWAEAIAGLIVTAAVFTLILSPLVLTRFYVGGPLESYSVTARTTGLLTAKDFLKDYWLQGAGMGNYTVVLHDQFNDLTGNQLQPVHNIFLLILTELGLFGLLFFLSFLLMIFWEGHHHPDPHIRSTRQAFAASLLIIPIFLGLWDHYLWSLPAGQWMFWTMTGLAVLVTHQHWPAELNRSGIRP